MLIRKQEMELRWVLTPTQYRESSAKAHDLGFQVTNAPYFYIEDIYFDSPRYSLREHGRLLRLRLERAVSDLECAYLFPVKLTYKDRPIVEGERASTHSRPEYVMVFETEWEMKAWLTWAKVHKWYDALHLYRNRQKYQAKIPHENIVWLVSIETDTMRGYEIKSTEGNKVQVFSPDKEGSFSEDVSGSRLFSVGFFSIEAVTFDRRLRAQAAEVRDLIAHKLMAPHLNLDDKTFWDKCYNDAITRGLI